MSLNFDFNSSVFGEDGDAPHGHLDPGTNHIRPRRGRLLQQLPTSRDGYIRPILRIRVPNPTQLAAVYRSFAGSYYVEIQDRPR